MARLTIEQMRQLRSATASYDMQNTYYFPYRGATNYMPAPERHVPLEPVPSRWQRMVGWVKARLPKVKFSFGGPNV